MCEKFHTDIREYSLPEGLIPFEGIEAVSRYIRGEKPNLYFLNPSYIADMIGCDWVVKGNQKYVGTFPKRISKLVWLEFNIKVEEQIISEVGNIASRYLTNSSKILADFSNEFDWDAGDYGDDGSCFWSCRTAAKAMMQENGGWAMRFYDNNRNGIGRCWVMPVRHNNENGYVVFNAYGSNRDCGLWIHARLIAGLLGFSYKKIDYLVNGGSDEGKLYINGGRGIVIGPENLVNNIERYDFEIDEPDRHECYNCGETVYDEDGIMTHNHREYCESCFDEIFTRCDNCSESVETDDAEYLSGNYYCCVTCAREDGWEWCDRCDEPVRKTYDTACGNLCIDCKDDVEEDEDDEEDEEDTSVEISYEFINTVNHCNCDFCVESRREWDETQNNGS